jgi:hypothetical protein
MSLNKIKRASALISTLLLSVFAEKYSPYEGLTKIVWTPGPSDIYLSNDNGSSGKSGGISPLYSPEMSYSEDPTRAVGNIPNRKLSSARFTLSSSQGFAGVSKDVLYKYYDNNQTMRTESLDPSPIKLGGYYIVILYPFQKAISQKAYLSTNEENGPYFKVDDDSIEALKSAIKNQISYTTAGFKFVPSNQIQIKNGTVLSNEYAGLNASEYLKVYSNLLSKYQVRYESVIFVQSIFNTVVGINGIGNYLPAILVPYGTRGLAYAMYGVWHDDVKAREYGFKAGQRIYFSEKILLPDIETKTKYPDIELLQIEPAMRYGKYVLSEEEILKDKKKYFPLLAWRTFKAWSEMNKDYDQDSMVIKIQGQDEYPPNTPDNADNTNGPGLNDCSDMDWYWDLYCRCVEGKLKDKEETVDSKKFQDYKDYLGTQIMQQQYDPTVYGTDGSTSPQKIETGNQPFDPNIYNKDCQLLSGKDIEIYDPFAKDSYFYLYQRYYDNDILNQHVGWFKREKDISDKIQNCMKELENVYNYYVLNKGKEAKWGYIRQGNNYYKKWPNGGDIEISIEKPELVDSVWYLGNSLANYTPFETFRQFAVYDNYAAQGQGPFHTIANEADDRYNYTDQPEYKRYKNGFIGSDIPSEQAFEKKDWYVQWKYNLIFKDKYGSKYSVGTLTFTSNLWKGEQDHIMPPNYEWKGDKLDFKVGIGGKTPFNDPATGYSKNSKDYRTDQSDPAERSPDAEIDKGEAMWEIARKIAVAELFNLATKTVHYISQRNDQAGTAAKIAYEASKRFENTAMVRKTCELAKDMYKGYVFWRETMDIIRDCRDTYNSISAAWDGLRTSALGLFNYYKRIDFKKVRLTNITQLLPLNYLYDIDMSVYCLQSSLVSFNKSINALAFQSDRLTRGNYGPFNPVILYATAQLIQATGQSGEATTRFLENTTSALNQVHQGAANNIANKAYLSNITKATYNAITNQRLMVMNERNRSAAVGLFILQQEANDWVVYSNHMRYASGNAANWTNQAIHNNFNPIIDGFRSPPGLFRDQGYWDALAKNEGDGKK